MKKYIISLAVCFICSSFTGAQDNPLTPSHPISHKIAPIQWRTFSTNSLFDRDFARSIAEASINKAVKPAAALAAIGGDPVDCSQIQSKGPIAPCDCDRIQQLCKELCATQGSDSAACSQCQAGVEQCFERCGG